MGLSVVEGVVEAAPWVARTRSAKHWCWVRMHLTAFVMDKSIWTVGYRGIGLEPIAYDYFTALGGSMGSHAVSSGGSTA